MTDRYGRQQFLTNNPWELNPLGDVAHLGAGIGGPLTAIGSGLINVDLAKAFRTGLSSLGQNTQLQPIVAPGALPPDEAQRERLRFVTEHVGIPTFTRPNS